jgi:hypothetical protein
MKYFSSSILFLLILFTAHYSNSQCPSPFETDSNFKGRVHKISYSTESFSESGEQLSQTSGIHEFDINGRQIKHEEVPRNLRWERIVSSFDKNGNEIFTKCFSGTDNYEMYKYKYDKNNNLILVEFYDNNGTKLLEKSVYTYDENCLRLEIQYFYCKDSVYLTAKQEFVFNDSKQKVSAKLSDNLGDRWYSSSYFYEYDLQGNLIKEIIKNSDGSVRSFQEFTLDYYNNTNKIKKSTSTKKKNYYTIYDEKGNWIERRTGDYLEKRTIEYY